MADEQAWVDTIKSVETAATLRISTMDWLGQSQFMKQTVYWSSLSSAISEVTSDIIGFKFLIFNSNYIYETIGCLFQACKSEDSGSILGTFY